MSIVRIILQGLIGLIFGIATMLALSPLLASFREPGAQIAMLAVLGVVILLSAFAPGLRRTFGRGFLCLGAAVFILPFSALVLGVVTGSEVVAQAAEADRGATAVGATIGAGLITGAASFIGFIFGTVLLLVGLILSLGGRREVIVVERR